MIASSVLVAACGSSSVVGAQQGCTAVADVLSDGPDPGADLAGYAEAQVLPLHQLRLSDTKLREAVDKLAAAYQAYASNGGPALAARVASEEKVLNAICPGAAP